MHKKWQSKLTSGTQKSSIHAGAFVLCCWNIKQASALLVSYLMSSGVRNSAARLFGHMLVSVSLLITTFAGILGIGVLLKSVHSMNVWSSYWLWGGYAYQCGGHDSCLGTSLNNSAPNYWLVFIIQNQCILDMYYHCHYFDD